MPLPRPFVDNSYRTESVDLQPFGNTVSIETGSDNPFEDDQGIEVVTQQSGGMAGPDPRMRSRKTLVRGTRVTAHPAGVSRTYHTRSQANRQGFMPGMAGFAGLGIDMPTDDSGSGGDAAPADATDFNALTTDQDASLFAQPAPQNQNLFAMPAPGQPGSGCPHRAPQPRLQLPLPPRLPLLQQVAGVKAASGAATALTALTALTQAAGQTGTAVLAAQTKAAQAKAAQSKLPAAASALGKQVETYWPYIAGGVGLVLVLGLVFGVVAPARPPSSPRLQLLPPRPIPANAVAERYPCHSPKHSSIAPTAPSPSICSPSATRSRSRPARTTRSRMTRTWRSSPSRAAGWPGPIRACVPRRP